MFWQGCSSQSQSNPFDLYLSTAFYKVPFTCVDTAVFNRKQLLSLYPPSSTSILKLHYILGGFTLLSVSRAVVWSLLQNPSSLFPWSVLCPKEQGQHTHFSEQFIFFKNPSINLQKNVNYYIHFGVQDIYTFQIHLSSMLPKDFLLQRIQYLLHMLCFSSVCISH